MLQAQIVADGEKFDMEASFNESLDEGYSFKGVGGPFQYMSPSRVPAEMDPTAHRCGLVDYADSMRDSTLAVGESYYTMESFIEAVEEIKGQLKITLGDLEAQLEDGEGSQTSLESAIEEIEADLRTLDAIEPGDLE